jgi:DTW domain-containing protein YfiP
VVFPGEFVAPERVVTQVQQPPQAGDGTQARRPLARRPLFVLLDATWPEARKMFRKSPYLDALPVLSLQADHASRYQLRRSTRSEHFCTSEVAALCLALAGEAQAAAVLAAWLDVFTHHYQRAKHQLPADPTCEPHLHLQALCAAPAVQLP